MSEQVAQTWHHRSLLGSRRVFLLI